MSLPIDEYWKSQINISELTPIEKEKAKTAVEYIVDIFGTNIISIIKQKHPITKYVFGLNHAPWTWKWLVDFVEAAKLASTQINGTKILNKLINPDTFIEALFQVYIAKCVIDGKLRREFLEENNKNKIVDWKITDPDTNEELLVELTELSWESSDERDDRQALVLLESRIRKFCNLDGMPKLFWRGRLFKPYISRPTLEELSKKK
jgi:hypothetical protein